MKLLAWTLFFLCASLGAQEVFLAPGKTLAVTSSNQTKATVRVPEKASYRIENLDHADDPVEFSLAVKTPDGAWKTLAGNRNLKGLLDGTIEVPLEPGTDYLLVFLPPSPLISPLRFQIQKAAFSGLREQLKQDLTYALPDSLPLRERLTWKIPLAASQVRTAWNDRGDLFAAVLSSDKRSLSIWALPSGQRVGGPVSGTDAVGSFDLAVTPEGQPVIAYSSSDLTTGLKVRLWNSAAWIDQSPPETAFGPASWEASPQGLLLVFRAGSTAQDAVLQADFWNAGVWKPVSDRSRGPVALGAFDSLWFQNSLFTAYRVQREDRTPSRISSLVQDQVWNELDIPEIPGNGGVRLASTTDSLFSFWQTSDGGWLLYQLRSTGWQALPPPRWSRSDVSIKLESSGSGSSLWVAELGSLGLSLHEFDGSDWRTPLRLQALTPTNPSSVQFLNAPKTGKSGSLALVSGKDEQTLKVFDLP